MGLNIVCDCGKINFRVGSYIYFDDWRHKLARELGFDLDDYWKGIVTVNTPFKHLLMHSDAYGHLTPRQCRVMIKPMKRVIKNTIEKIRNPWNTILGTIDKAEESDFLESCLEWLEAFEHSSNDKCYLRFC